MITRTSSLLAALLSIPPVITVAALFSKLLPPAPAVPSVVAANDRRIDATGMRPQVTHHGRESRAVRPLAYHYESVAR